MRGISEERLKKIVEDYPPDHRNHRVAKYLIATECQELNQWIPLEEFLKSGFEGNCWIYLKIGVMGIGTFYNNTFSYRHGIFKPESVHRVAPIHKPEPPQDD